MTTTELSKAQLVTILSALDGEPRKPANKEAALKAIAKSAEQLGLTAEAVLATAPGLLDGQLEAEAWRAELTRQDAAQPATEPPQAAEEQEPAQQADAPAESAGAATEAPDMPVEVLPADAQPRVRRPREGSKEALVVSLLQRPEGATIEQIAATTGWQRHTVRGAFAGALKKKLGLEVTSSKVEGGERVYRIQPA
jgi:hypothetical protein